MAETRTLEELVECVRNHKMTPEEHREQRVSFVWGQMSGKLTKDEVRAFLTARGM